MNYSLARFALAFVVLFSAANQAQAIRIKDSDITNDQYSFALGYAEMANSGAVDQILSGSTGVFLRQEGSGPVYITPDPASSKAEIRVTFDFSRSSYVVESVFVRSVFNFFANPSEPSDVLVKTTISSDVEESHDLWSVLCRDQSRHEEPFESSVSFRDAKKITYSVSMDLGDYDTTGQFGDAAFQWNRLNSEEEDATRAYQIVFQLKKVR